MTLFSWLLVGHLVGDFLLQTRWMAQQKNKHWEPLVLHTVVYTLTVSLLAQLAGGLRWQAVALIFLSHLILDRRNFVNFWACRVTGSADLPWHILMLALAVWLSAL